MADPKSGWATIVIDRDAGKPALVGSRWRRRAPENDDWDKVVICGVHDNGPDHNGFELVVTPLAFGPCLTADPESFAAAYAREIEDDPALSAAARLRELEARAAA